MAIKINKNLIRLTVIYLFIMIIVISNLQVISNNAIRKLILYCTFIFLIFYYSLKCKISISKKSVFIALIVIFIEFYLILIKKYPLSHDRVIYLFMDMGMMYIGYNIFKYEDNKFINKVLKFYIIVCCFCCIYYLFKFDTNIIYGYDLKHCLAPNILISLIITIYNKSEIRKKMRLILIIIQVYTLLNLNSRSTLVGMIIAFLYILIKNRKRLIKFFTNSKRIAILIFVLPIVIYITYMLMISIYYGLRLDTLKQISIEAYSADRFYMIKYGLELFNNARIIGVGNTVYIPIGFYVECFYLDILVQLGIIGVVAYGFLFILILYSFNSKKINDKFIEMSICSILAGLSIGVFSANAPMGPGTAYSFLWLLLGMAISKKTQTKFS